MSLNGYMHSPVGFGVYGQAPQVFITEEDLAPLTPGEMNQFHGLSTMLSGLRGFALSVGVGTVVGLLARQVDHMVTVKNPLAEKIVSTIAAPAAASVAAIIVSKVVS